MDLFIELDTLQLIAAVNDRRRVASVEAKRGDALPLTLRFVQDGAVVRMPTGTSINFAVKESGKYDDGPLVLQEGFTASAVEDPDSDPKYTATPSLNTAELNALFLIDEDSSNDPAFFNLMAEVSWRSPGDTGPTTIKNFTFKVNNDVFRGDESLPQEIGKEVPGDAATYEFTATNNVDLEYQEGGLTIGSWDIAFVSEDFVSNPHGTYPSLVWSNPSNWGDVFAALAEVINTGTTDNAGFTVEETPGAQGDVTASVVTDGTNSTLVLTAISTGISGNTVTVAFNDSDTTFSSSGLMSGGTASRDLMLEDVVLTYERGTALTDAQKAAARADINALSADEASSLSRIPLPEDDNVIAELDVTDTASWTLGGYAIAASGGLVFTNNNGTSTSANATLAGVGTPTDGDFFWYLKVQADNARASSTQHAYLQIGDAAGSNPLIVDIGYDWENGGGGDVISIGFKNGGGLIGITTASMTVTELQEEHEIAVFFDSVRDVYNLYWKVAGVWEWQGGAAGVACDSGDLTVQQAGSPASTDFKIIESFFARANFASIGDSICAGHNGFNPLPSHYAGDDDWQNTWQYNFQPKRNAIGGVLRNNIVVNYGIGSETSEDINARVAEMITATSAPITFLHWSTNDSNLSNAIRVQWNQSSVDIITKARSRVVMLAPVYLNNNLTLRAQLVDAWENHREEVLGVTRFVSWNEQLYNGGTAIDATYLESDGVHPNVTGYGLMGQYILSLT